jgi:hypothetical protein
VKAPFESQLEVVRADVSTRLDPRGASPDGQPADPPLDLKGRLITEPPLQRIPSAIDVREGG